MFYIYTVTLLLKHVLLCWLLVYRWAVLFYPCVSSWLSIHYSLSIRDWEFFPSGRKIISCPLMSFLGIFTLYVNCSFLFPVSLQGCLYIIPLSINEREILPSWKRFYDFAGIVSCMFTQVSYLPFQSIGIYIQNTFTTANDFCIFCHWPKPTKSSSTLSLIYCTISYSYI